MSDDWAPVLVGWTRYGSKKGDTRYYHCKKARNTNCKAAMILRANHIYTTKGATTTYTWELSTGHKDECQVKKFLQPTGETDFIDPSNAQIFCNTSKKAHLGKKVYNKTLKPERKHKIVKANRESSNENEATPEKREIKRSPKLSDYDETVEIAESAHFKEKDNTIAEKQRNIEKQEEIIQQETPKGSDNPQKTQRKRKRRHDRNSPRVNYGQVLDKQIEFVDLKKNLLLKNPNEMNINFNKMTFKYYSDQNTIKFFWEDEDSENISFQKFNLTPINTAEELDIDLNCEDDEVQPRDLKTEKEYAQLITKVNVQNTYIRHKRNIIDLKMGFIFFTLQSHYCWYRLISYICSNEQSAYKKYFDAIVDNYAEFSSKWKLKNLNNFVQEEISSYAGPFSSQVPQNVFYLLELEGEGSCDLDISEYISLKLRMRLDDDIDEILSITIDEEEKQKIGIWKMMMILILQKFIFKMDSIQSSLEKIIGSVECIMISSSSQE